MLAHALGSRQFTPAWDRYQKWLHAVGDLGVVYLSTGYSGMGELLSLWMGIENVMYATADFPRVLHKAIDQINEANLRRIDLVAQSPAEIVLMGDNFSSDTETCGELISNTVMPLCQYFAYIEVLDEREAPILRSETNASELWRCYKRVAPAFENFAMKRVFARSDIFPVFHELFAKGRKAA